jgi:hypothetical protein
MGQGDFDHWGLSGNVGRIAPAADSENYALVRGQKTMLTTCLRRNS